MLQVLEQPSAETAITFESVPPEKSEVHPENKDVLDLLKTGKKTKQPNDAKHR